MRVAIFGGTFDPVHQGHMVIAEQVMGELTLDRAVFVPGGTQPHQQASRGGPLPPARGVCGPGGTPPHKEAASVRATAEDRYAMVEAAVEANERFSADRGEVEAGRRRHSAETGRTRTAPPRE